MQVRDQENKNISIVELPKYRKVVFFFVESELMWNNAFSYFRKKSINNQHFNYLRLIEAKRIFVSVTCSMWDFSPLSSFMTNIM